MRPFSILPRLVLPLVLAILFPACEASESDLEPKRSDTGDPVQIEKSFKRGLAYDLQLAEDLDTLKHGVSWWYNWYFDTDAPAAYHVDYDMEFIPMLWGRNADSDFDAVKIFLLDHPEIDYLLVLNEPNLSDQANMSPAQAATEWVRYESLISDLEKFNRDVKLVGPAMNWGTMNNYWNPVVWLDAFYAEYRSRNGGQDPRIDYLAFHWYDYGLTTQLDSLAKYGKQIWITEMANWNAQINSYTKQAEQMIEMVNICESRDDVFRYAWFIGRGAENHFSNLFNEDPGDLNMLGQLYLSLPYGE